MSTGEIQEIKEKVGQDAEKIIARQLHFDRIGSKYRCPDRMAHRHGDRTPSMAWDDRLLQFKCFGCGKLIDIYSMYKDYLNYTHAEIVREILGKDRLDETNMAQNRAKLEEKTEELMALNDVQMAYLTKRRLKESTIHTFRLQDYQGSIAFPYYQNEILIGCKTRRPEKHTKGAKYMSLPGSKPGLFHYDGVNSEKSLIICEGEIDCMIIYQAGFENVVSVGAGANSLTDLIEQYKDFFNQFISLIIFSDNDEAGTNMDDAFFKAFPDKTALIDKAIMNGKDANEIYLHSGEAAIRQIIESGKEKIEGFFNPDTDDISIKEVFGRGKFIPTRLPSIDYALNDFAPGCVTLVAGRANGGKSTFLNQTIASAIQEECKVLLISGEDEKRILVNKLYQAVIGRDSQLYDFVMINKRKFKVPKPSVMKILKEWHEDKLHIFMKGESNLKTTEQLFEMVSRKIRIEKYDLVVIDNLMSVLSIKSAAEKNDAQADFVQRCCDLAKLYHCHIALVLHPNKTFHKGDTMDFEQIAGSSDIGNKADNIIAIMREYEEEQVSNGRDGYAEILKNRYFSDIVKVTLHFDKETGLLMEVDENGGVSRISFDYTRNNKHNTEIEGFQEIMPWEE